MTKTLIIEGISALFVLKKRLPFYHEKKRVFTNCTINLMSIIIVALIMVVSFEYMITFGKITSISETL